MAGSSLLGITGLQAITPVLKMGGNGAITGVLTTVTDGLGNDTALKLSTLAASILALDSTPIGVGGASTGAFTTLSASSTVSGAGFTALFASPPSIGSTVPGSGAFTSLSATLGLTVSGGTFAQGRYYYDASLGLVIGCKTGSAWDFSLYDPAGGTQLLGCEVGAANMIVRGVGRFTSAGLALTGVLTTTGNVGIQGAADCAFLVGAVTGTGVIAAHLTSATGAFLQITDQGVQDFAIGSAHSANTLSIWSGRNIAAAGTKIAEFYATGNGFAVVGGLGCNGKTPQTAYASGGVLAAYGAGANGFDTAGHAQALYLQVQAIQAALVADGIMS